MESHRQPFPLIGAHQCGVLMVSTMAATSMSIHHLWLQQRQHKLGGSISLDDSWSQVCSPETFAVVPLHRLG